MLAAGVETSVHEHRDPGDRTLVIDDGEQRWKGVGTAVHLAACGVDVSFALVEAEPGGDLTGLTTAWLRRSRASTRAST